MGSKRIARPNKAAKPIHGRQSRSLTSLTAAAVVLATTILAFRWQKTHKNTTFTIGQVCYPDNRGIRCHEKVTVVHVIRDFFPAELAHSWREAMEAAWANKSANEWLFTTNNDGMRHVNTNQKLRSNDNTAARRYMAQQINASGQFAYSKVVVPTTPRASMRASPRILACSGPASASSATER